LIVQFEDGVRGALEQLEKSLFAQIPPVCYTVNEEPGENVV